MNSRFCVLWLLLLFLAPRCEAEQATASDRQTYTVKVRPQAHFRSTSHHVDETVSRSGEKQIQIDSRWKVTTNSRSLTSIQFEVETSGLHSNTLETPAVELSLVRQSATTSWDESKLSIHTRSWATENGSRESPWQKPGTTEVGLQVIVRRHGTPTQDDKMALVTIIATLSVE